MAAPTDTLRLEIARSERSLADRSALLRGYILALAEVVEALGVDAALEQVVSDSSFGRIRRKSVKPESIWPYLRSAWRREAQLIGQVTEAERVPFASAQWPDDLYSISKAATSAFIASTGRVTRPDHGFILQTVSSELERRGGLFAPPWGLLIGRDRGWHIQGIPGAGLIAADTRDPLSPSPWDRLVSLMQSAHQDREARGQATKQSNLFGALFWLRNRSVYSDDFRSDAPRSELVRFGEGCLVAAGSVLASMELLVSAYIGLEAYKTIVDEFVRTRPERGDVRGLLRRMDQIRMATQ